MDVEALAEKWKKEVFDPVGLDSISEETCYRSMCLGWGLAQGLSVDEALTFYRKLIPLKLF